MRRSHERQACDRRLLAWPAHRGRFPLLHHSLARCSLLRHGTPRHLPARARAPTALASTTIGAASPPSRSPTAGRARSCAAKVRLSRDSDLYSAALARLTLPRLQIAPGLDFARLMGEERENLWRKLCVKDAQATTDLSLVARSRAGEHGYTIDVHSLVLRQHEWFKVLLDGSFEEGANGGAVQADEANASAASAGQATSSSRKKVRARWPQLQDRVLTAHRQLIKLGVSHEALVLLVEGW